MSIRPPIRGAWREDLPARGVYAEGAGIHRILPEAVAVPADADDVTALVRWAAAARKTLTPRGSGSSMAGGAVGPGVVLDLSRLDHIGDIDRDAKSVIVGPGVVCADLGRAAAAAGLRLPVDPSSAAFCTIGGMASTNAAGGRTLRYGQMGAWVRGIECVFATGERTWIRRGQSWPRTDALARFEAQAEQLRRAEQSSPSPHAGVRKESSGYAIAAWARSGDLVDLLAGSEGTLAIFTALEIQLADIPPVSGTIVAAFDTLESAASAAARAAAQNASACELLDRSFLDIARAGGKEAVPEGEAVLVAEIEETDADRLRQAIDGIATSFRSAGATSIRSSAGTSESAALWALRHAASPILAAMSDAVTSMQIIEDGAVPPSQLPDYVRGIRRILAESGFAGVIFGHAGDGHVHVNVLVNLRARDWRARIERIMSEAVVLTASLGGTMTGEHGDGRLRAAALDQLWTKDALDRFRSVKDAFDPAGMFNPGVKFPSPDAPLLGGPVKYDPALPPLPAAVRRVLDRVQAARAWNRSRLELLDEEQRR